MERVLDFSDVTSYDFSLMGSGMILKLFQGDVVTKICIGTGQGQSSAKPKSIPVKVNTSQAQRQAVVGVVTKNNEARTTKTKRILNETQVREIRNNWNETVKACGTKNAAADQLAKIYNCSAKNIYAIIYRYSWANI